MTSLLLFFLIINVFPIFFSDRETRVELLTVHPCEGVCLAVNIHWIAKEREIINWSRRFAFLSRMLMRRKKKDVILVDEGLGWTLHAGSRERSGGNFLAKSCRSRLQQSGPGAEVWQVRSMTARWIQEHEPAWRCRCFSKPGQWLNSHSVPSEHTPVPLRGRKRWGPACRARYVLKSRWWPRWTRHKLRRKTRAHVGVSLLGWMR